VNGRLWDLVPQNLAGAEQALGYLGFSNLPGEDNSRKRFSGSQFASFESKPSEYWIKAAIASQ
jgi:hypothetical protein